MKETMLQKINNFSTLLLTEQSFIWKNISNGNPYQFWEYFSDHPFRVSIGRPLPTQKLHDKVTRNIKLSFCDDDGKTFRDKKYAWNELKEMIIEMEKYLNMDLHKILCYIRDFNLTHDQVMNPEFMTMLKLKIY